MSIAEKFSQVRSGVLQVSFLTGATIRSIGSAFLVPGGLVTNHHVLYGAGSHQSVCFRFEDDDPDDATSYILLPTNQILNTVATESAAHQQDYAFLKLDDPKFAGRHQFEFAADDEFPKVGEQIGFLGFPFGTIHLTAHLGYVSSVHVDAGVKKIQIDGSVNGGNSGGPAIDLASGKVVGIVTRAHSGFVAEQFDKLLQSFDQNINFLKQAGQTGGIVMMGVNIMDALSATQAGMKEVASNLRRSANVGIGFAFSSEYVRDAIAAL